MSRNRLSIRFLALLLIAPTIGVIVGAYRARLFSAAQEQIELPDRWVPFQADVKVTFRHKDDVAFGRFYRGADGSRRLDSGPSAHDVRVTFIYNAPEDRVYGFTAQQGWTVERANAKRTGRDLPPKSLPIRGTTRQAFGKAALFRGQSGSLNALEGLLTYRTDSPDGSTFFSSPELNGFDVMAQNAEGRTETYSNIELVTPPSSLFAAPSGAVITPKASPPRGLLEEFRRGGR
jgi:hypothetical protein